MPTGHGTKQIYEPLVGGNHIGAGVGPNADYLIYECGNNSLDFSDFDARYAYFFKHEKCVRSIYLTVIYPVIYAGCFPKYGCTTN